ncbi:hypothetical protein V494_07128 [Pseudogymnoascus sp. VKM F-4513 (FW-928)]|nr:hypothetical protein V494_07128 [Pseudogymnoascus sp. VKM F-4513 (FW-928)]
MVTKSLAAKPARKTGPGHGQVWSAKKKLLAGGSLRGLPHQLSSPSSKTSSLFFFFFVLIFFESSAIPESSIHPGNSLNQNNT